MRVVTSLFSLVFLVSCGQPKASEAKKDPVKVEPKSPETKPVVAETKPAASAPTSAQTSTASAPAGYPPYPYEGLPGWLAVASVETFSMDGAYWSPVSSTFQAGIFAVNDDWKGIAAGTRLTAMGQSSGAEVVFSKLGEEPYGCDKIPTKMATFTGPKLPEGVVWLLPKDVTGAAPVEIKAGTLVDIPAPFSEDAKKAKANRVFLIGDTKLLYVATGVDKGTITAFIGDKKLWEEKIDRQHMEGASPDPISFKDKEIQVSFPRAAYRFGEKWPVAIIFDDSGYEGVGFSILRVTESEAKIIEGIGAYYCAF